MSSRKKEKDWFLRWEPYWFVFMAVIVLILTIKGGLYVPLFIGLGCFLFWGISGTKNTEENTKE